MTQAEQGRSPELIEYTMRVCIRESVLLAVSTNRHCISGMDLHVPLEARPTLQQHHDEDARD